MTYSRVLIAIISVVVMSGFLQADVDIWSTNGPFAARISDIVFHPSYPNYIYIGTIEDGIYYTCDAGSSWNHLDADILPPTIRRIKFHPEAPETMYTTTSQGLYKSNNSGENWQFINLPNSYNGDIMGFEIHPSQPSILFCNGWFLNYKSIDGGNTWTELDLPWLWAEKIVSDPRDSNRVYLITHSGTYGLSIYVSNDIGDSWECIHNNLDTTLIARDLAIDPEDNSTLYIAGGTVFDTNIVCIERSDNGGQSWINISPDFLTIDLVETIAISPTDNNIIYAGTFADGVIKSNDKGQTWESINNNLTHHHAYRFNIDPTTGILYLSVLYDGLYKSIDGGEEWIKISSNISNAFCTGLAISTNDVNKIYASTYKNLYFSDDRGINWNQMNLEWPIAGYCLSSGIIIDACNDAYIYGGYSHVFGLEQGGIFKSDNGGITWDFITGCFPDNTIITDLALGNYGNGFRRLFSCTNNGIFFSDDLGENWNESVDGLPANSSYSAIEICKNNPIFMYASDYSRNLYCSSDSGISWQTITLPEEGNYCNEIKCDPNDPSKIYICIYNSGIYKSNNGGDTWVNITNNIPYGNHLWFSGFAINSQNSNNIFVNSHHHGIFQSHDAGNNWEPFNEGLNLLYSNAITLFDPIDTCQIYLATDQQSAWSITRTPVAIDDDVADLPTQLSITAYPNPFNAATSIRYSLAVPSHVTLDIYNVLGQRVERLIDLRQGAGDYNIIWRPDELPSGMYLARLYAVDFDHVIKLMMVK